MSPRWWDRLFLSRKILSDVQAATWGNSRILAEIRHKIDEMGTNMADVSQVLNDVAEGLRGNLGPRIAELLAENAALRGEDAAESAAAENVRTAFEEVARAFDGTDEVPTPDPLPEPGQGEGGPESEPVDQG